MVLAAAAGLCWYGWTVLDAARAGDQGAEGASMKYLVPGLSLALFGLFLLLAPRPKERFRPMPTADLLVALGSTPPPFYVCVDCRILLPLEAAMGRCPRCSSAAACLEVSGPGDLATVRSALGG